MNKKHKGARSELRAAAWLLTRGYEVFRNVSQHGPVDLVALDLKADVMMKIDVKTLPPSENIDKLKRKAIHGVHIIYFDPTKNKFILITPKEIKKW